MIKSLLIIFLGLGSTLLVSQPVMTALQQVIVAPGQEVIVLSSAEYRSEMIAFTVAIGACISLIVWVACDNVFFSLQAGIPLILGGTLLGAIVSGFYQAKHLRQATLLIDKESYGPAVALQHLALDTILWAGFFIGLLTRYLMTWIAKRQNNTEVSCSFFKFLIHQSARLRITATLPQKKFRFLFQ